MTIIDWIEMDWQLRESAEFAYFWELW